MDNIIDEVIEQIKRDIEAGDQTAIAELLECIPLNILKGFLSEVQ